MYRGLGRGTVAKPVALGCIGLSHLPPASPPVPLSVADRPTHGAGTLSFFDLFSPGTQAVAQSLLGAIGTGSAASRSERMAMGRLLVREFSNDSHFHKEAALLKAVLGWDGSQDAGSGWTLDLLRWLGRVATDGVDVPDGVHGTAATDPTEARFVGGAQSTAAVLAYGLALALDPKRMPFPSGAHCSMVTHLVENCALRARLTGWEDAWRARAAEHLGVLGRAACEGIRRVVARGTTTTELPTELPTPWPPAAGVLSERARALLFNQRGFFVCDIVPVAATAATETLVDWSDSTVAFARSLCVEAFSSTYDSKQNIVRNARAELDREILKRARPAALGAAARNAGRAM